MTPPTDLELLLLERSVQRGDFTLASGQRSSYYIDCRLTTMSSRGLILVGRAGLASILAHNWTPDAIGGLTMGADPVAYAISAASYGSASPMEAFSVRKEAKGHGTKRQIEGNFSPGSTVVVVEDVITSGSSAIQAVDAVRNGGGIVTGVLAVVDREQGGKARIEAKGVSVVSLTTATRLGLSE